MEQIRLGGELLKTCRKDYLFDKTIGIPSLIDNCSRELLMPKIPLGPATGQPALRQQELYTGFYSEREKLLLRCAKSLTGVWINPYQQKAVIQGIP